MGSASHGRSKYTSSLGEHSNQDIPASPKPEQVPRTSSRVPRGTDGVTGLRKPAGVVKRLSLGPVNVLMLQLFQQALLLRIFSMFPSLIHSEPLRASTLSRELVIVCATKVYWAPTVCWALHWA